MSSTTNARLLDYEQAATYLGVPKPTLRDWVYRRRIPFVKAGPERKSTVRFDVADLDRWIDDHKVPARSRS